MKNEKFVGLVGLVGLVCSCSAQRALQVEEAVEVRRDTVVMALERETAATLHGVTLLSLADTQRVVRIERIEVERRERASAAASRQSEAVAVTTEAPPPEKPKAKGRSSLRTLVLAALAALVIGFIAGRRKK